MEQEENPIKEKLLHIEEMIKSLLSSDIKDLPTYLKANEFKPGDIVWSIDPNWRKRSVNMMATNWIVVSYTDDYPPEDDCYGSGELVISPASDVSIKIGVTGFYNGEFTSIDGAEYQFYRTNFYSTEEEVQRVININHLEKKLIESTKSLRDFIKSARYLKIL